MRAAPESDVGHRLELPTVRDDLCSGRARCRPMPCDAHRRVIPGILVPRRLFTHFTSLRLSRVLVGCGSYRASLDHAERTPRCGGGTCSTATRSRGVLSPSLAVGARAREASA